ncbi:chorismate mutase [bacterium (Candidatus Moisslbacteria) CG02_land_8_20_14_3_00_36_53]|nr:MAG: chorismate mutase [bacterium (Candidatus Moisslbacteria) CG02_land_8_20_14_3_00_36_53]PIZ90217.1 MAG: chorismate mutase [bacterium (Candidatus Moisslbacteria) CG_4_10_14_0_2_um_filter_36_61]
MDNDLKKYRKIIDSLDKKLIWILSQRFKVTQKIGEYKAKNNLPIQDKKREEEALESRKSLAQKLNLDPDLISEIFKLVFKCTRKNHKKIKEKRKNEKN